MGMRIITLTTDFGSRDEYVGVIKGVILKINPQARLVDISHELPPQGVVAAGELLKAAFPWFPEGTIHVAVVDPGVGTDRAILAARHAGHLFVAPDNGLLPVVLAGQAPQTLVHVREERFFLHPVSATFHGRDIFAPVAAHLAQGVDLHALGPELQGPAPMRTAELPALRWEGKTTLVGEVTGADRFGNLRTNIGRAQMDQLISGGRGRRLVVTVGRYRIGKLSQTYAYQEQGRVMALLNSRDQLEIAVAGGSAASLFKTFQGLQVRVTAQAGKE